MKLIFCGTPEFSVPCLDALVEAGHEVDLVLTQPDRPAGRKLELQVPAVKQRALSLGLAVEQPEKIKNNLELRERLEGIRPDAIVVVAYGRIVPQWMLDLPRYGNINVHGSLLPKYRGAAPIQWAVANGETETGVTTMRLDAGLDTGEILLMDRISIGHDATSAELYPQLAQMGAQLLLRTLAGLEDGSVIPQQQDDAEATLAPILTREDGRLRLEQPAQVVYNRWRGFYPWPGCWSTFRMKRLLIYGLRPFGEVSSLLPGELELIGGELCAGAAGGTAVALDEVQMEGKSRMAERLLRVTSSCWRVSDLARPEKRFTGGGDSRRSAAPAVHHAGPVTAARRVAFGILEKVGVGSAHSDDLLHGVEMAALSPVDRNLATALVMGVLRWQLALDARMLPLLQRPELGVESPVATALRMGAFQLLHMDRIPAHAALSESVELVRAAGHGHAAAMVNAILRKLQRQEPAKPKLYESTDAFAERLSHPDWLVERWVKQYGRAATLAVCEHDQREPEAGGLFAAQAAFPMDDGSRLVAELAAASVAAPQRIWDCCAAPGGKTMVLAARHPEAELLATDVHARRLQAMAKRLAEAGAKVRVELADAAKPRAEDGGFDLILCDVPCSGTGTLGRNPEIKERLQPSDLARQAARQREILAGALERLKVGGRLVYSTCSLEPEENEQVVDAVLAAHPAFGTVGLDATVERLAGFGLVAEGKSLEPLLKSGRLRTLPGVGFEGDGFFAALLERVG